MLEVAVATESHIEAKHVCHMMHPQTPSDVIVTACTYVISALPYSSNAFIRYLIEGNW